MARWELPKLRQDKEATESREELSDKLENFVVKEQQAKQRIRQLRTVVQDPENSCESNS